MGKRRYDNDLLNWLECDDKRRGFGVGLGGAVMKTKEQNLEFNYELQVWTLDGIILPCGHLPQMRVNGPCCNGWKYAGKKIEQIEVVEII